MAAKRWNKKRANRDLIGLHYLEDKRDIENKVYQEYVAFIRTPEVVRAIEELRRKRSIVPSQIKQHLQLYAAISEANDKAAGRCDQESEKQGLQRGTNEFFRFQDESGFTGFMEREKTARHDLGEFVSKKLRQDDVSRLLYRFNKPASWEDSLRGRVLIDVIRTPDTPYRILLTPKFVRIELYSDSARAGYLLACKGGVQLTKMKMLKNGSPTKDGTHRHIEIIKRKDRCWIDLYPGCTVREARSMYPRIFRILKQLPGARLRTIRQRSSQNTKTLIAVRHEHYKKMSEGKPLEGVNAKAVERLELIDMAFQNTLDLPEEMRDEMSQNKNPTAEQERKIWASIRQTSSRRAKQSQGDNVLA